MLIPASPDGNTFLSQIPENTKLPFLLGCPARQWWIFRMRAIVVLPDGRKACTCPAGAACPVIGKHPAQQWTKPIDPNWKGAQDYVRNWFSADPEAGWGIHLGLSRLVAVDIDPKNGGLSSLDKWRERGLLAGVEPTVFTGSGGFHFFFQAPDNCDPIKGWRGPNGEYSTSFKPAPGIDFFAGQHLLVLPFSPHKSGCNYSASREIFSGPCPDNIVAEINGQPKFQEHPRPARLATVHGATGPLPSQSAVLSAAWAYVQAAPPPVHDGTHSRTMCKLARLLWGEFGLERADVISLLIRRDAEAGNAATPKEYERFADYGEKYVGTRGWRLNVHDGGAERAGADVFAKVGKLEMSFGNWRLNTLTGEIERETSKLEVKIDPALVSEEIGDAVLLPAPGLDAVEQMEPPQAIQCQFRCTVCLQHIRTSRYRLQRFPCRRLICPACFIRKKEHYRSTVSYRLLQHHVAMGRGPDAKGYFAYIPVAAWAKLGRRIRAEFGDFFRVDLHARDRESGPAYLVVSTEPAGKADWKECSLLEAQSMLWAAIDGLARNLRKRVFWTSRGWKLFDDTQEKPKEWKRKHSVRCSPKAQRNILEFHGIVTEPVYGGGNLWGWSGDEFRCSKELWPKVEADLDAGMILSLDIEIIDGPPVVFAEDDRTPEEIFLSG